MNGSRRRVEHCKNKKGRVNMHADLALRMMANLLWTGISICLPILAVIMVVGLTISLLQVVTQVQEMSLTFVPKLIATGIVLIALGPWMLRKLTSYSAQLWSSIPSLF
jgi:flagellar biosynthetic protein FliQ